MADGSCVKAHGEWGMVQPDHLKYPGRAPLRTVAVGVGAGHFACYECAICRAEFWVREYASRPIQPPTPEPDQ